MEVQNLSFNRDPEEAERMLRQLGHKIQNIADRVKRIGSYSLSMELSEIAANLDRICDSQVDELELDGVDRSAVFTPEALRSEHGPHVQ